MSLRYMLEIRNKKIDSVQYIQIFGNNRFIKKLHEFAGIETPEPFEKELNTNSLRALYTVVDNYCKDFAMQGGTFNDLTDPFNSSINFDEFFNIKFMGYGISVGADVLLACQRQSHNKR